MFSSVPWWLFLSIFVLIAIPVGIAVALLVKGERLRARAGLEHLNRMDLPEFLRYLHTLFSGLGYQVEKVPARDDYGVDLILTDGTGRRTAVQARRFMERQDAGVIRELSEGAGYHRCKDALLISTRGFTNAAITMAEEMGAILWDVNDLAEAMDKVRTRPSFSARAAERAAAPAAAGRPSPPPPAPAEAVTGLTEPTGPPCPICRKPMMAREAAGRGIWLCSRFPRCNGASLR